MDSSIDIKSYRPVVGANEIEEIKMLSEKLRGIRFHNVNSTAAGGGVAEILTRLVPLLRNLGIDASWSVIKGGDDFFEVTKAFHNALHGKKVTVTDAMFRVFERYTELNVGMFDREADCYFIHDPQPVGLIARKNGRNGSRWVWRCHVDVSNPDPKVWEYLKNHVEKYDASVFSMPEFSRHLSIPQFMVAPSIDPLSDKNKELDRKYVDDVIEKYGIDYELPVVSQISRFDRLKDPVGVIAAYKLVKKKTDCQLVLAGGGASDDPEGGAVLDEARRAAG
ncbi:MAG: glycosyl transferase family 1, partial [bacterium]